jgi:hypothetical protein
MIAMAFALVCLLFAAEVVQPRRAECRFARVADLSCRESCCLAETSGRMFV